MKQANNTLRKSDVYETKRRECIAGQGETAKLLCSIVFGPYAAGDPIEVNGTISQVTGTSQQDTANVESTGSLERSNGDKVVGGGGGGGGLGGIGGGYRGVTAKRTSFMYGMCWEGVINLRRLIQVFVVTFANDILVRHIILTIVSFVVLLIHLRARPFKYSTSNNAESASLSLLQLVAIANLVKAGFYNSQTVPQDNGYLVIVFFEWIETSVLVLLPAAICISILFRVVFRGARCVVRRPVETNSSESRKSPTKRIVTRRKLFRKDEMLGSPLKSRMRRRQRSLPQSSGPVRLKMVRHISADYTNSPGHQINNKLGTAYTRDRSLSSITPPWSKDYTPYRE